MPPDQLKRQLKRRYPHALSPKREPTEHALLVAALGTETFIAHWWNDSLTLAKKTLTILFSPL